LASLEVLQTDINKTLKEVNEIKIEENILSLEISNNIGKLDNPLMNSSLDILSNIFIEKQNICEAILFFDTLNNSNVSLQTFHNVLSPKVMKMLKRLISHEYTESNSQTLTVNRTILEFEAFLDKHFYLRVDQSEVYMT
jgi:hypothetical protein